MEPQEPPEQGVRKEATGSGKREESEASKDFPGWMKMPKQIRDPERQRIRLQAQINANTQVMSSSLPLSIPKLCPSPVPPRSQAGPVHRVAPGHTRLSPASQATRVQTVSLPVVPTEPQDPPCVGQHQSCLHARADPGAQGVKHGQWSEPSHGPF